MKRVTKPVISASCWSVRRESACGRTTPAAKADAPKVATALVTRGAVADVVAATGTLQAVTTVQVGTQVSGTIAWLGADFNSIVHKGQVIAKLDPSLFETQVEQARANQTKVAADLDNAQVKVADAQQQYSGQGARREAAHRPKRSRRGEGGPRPRRGHRPIDSRRRSRRRPP